MQAAAIGFLLGLLICQQLAQLPSIHWVLLAILFFPLLFLSKQIFSKIIIWASIGFLWSLFYAHLHLADQLIPSLEGKDLVVGGTVSSIPHFDGNRTRFRFSVSELLITNQTNQISSDLPKTLLLNWYEQATSFKAGDYLRLKVRLKRAHGFMNPGGFDYESWIFQQRIDGVGYVKARLNSGEISPSRLPNAVINKFRQQLLEAQFNSLDDKSFHGIIAAVTVGERHGIDDTQWRILTDTGTNHLMAISGLHIGLVSGLVFFLIQYLWAFFPALAIRWPAPQVAAIFSIISALSYAALAGFSIPTQRALIMVAAVMLGILLRRRILPENALSMALIFVLILDPLAVLSAGFWLSFTAVAIILYALNQRVADKGLWVKYGKIQIVTLVGLTPFLAMFFQKISLVSPIANIVAVPWMSIVTIPLTLLGSLLMIPLPVLGEFLLYLSHWSLVLLWPLLSWLAELPLSTLPITVPSPVTFVLVCVGVIWILAPSGMTSKWLGTLFFLPLLVSPSTVKKPIEGTAFFTLLDVGQGLSAVIQTAKHTLVYDTGPRYNNRFDTGRAVVLPYLSEFAIDKIDTLIISHGDNDHIGGAKSIIKNTTVDRILTSVPFKIDAGNVLNCTKNMQWIWDGVRFSILHPDSTDRLKQTSLENNKSINLGRLNSNNMSCVLLIETKSGSVLLTGDIEKKVEKKLVTVSKSGLIDLSADILVVSHHGSLTSSDPNFIDYVNPKYALFAVGYRNRYGFPKQKIVERYLQRDIELFDTSQYGAITFELGHDEGVTRPDLYRNTVRRYWNTMPFRTQTK